MSGWGLLSEELDRWHAARKTATFWWRDDDAVDVTPQLERLVAVAGSVPLSLAVIPSRATTALADRLRGNPAIAVFQHGWAHVSHRGDHDEFPETRPVEDVAAELRRGRERLTALFGAQALAVFVPPWHAFDDAFLPLLPEHGLHGISRKGPRPARRIGELIQTNAHVSPIVWSTPPGFAGDDDALSKIVEHLEGRRTGRYDDTEPTGLLTHHLDQTPASFDFMERFAGVVSDHPGAAWCSAETLFTSALSS